jgi:DNA repair photolyase
MKQYQPLYPSKLEGVYNLDRFLPVIIDEGFLRARGITGIPNDIVARLNEGSKRFVSLLKTRKLTAPKGFSIVDNPNPIQVHNYTGICPTNVLEVNPSIGSCSISCLYCLVNDGDQREPIKVFGNYPSLLKRKLAEQKDENTFFYFSPKVDAFSEPLLVTGIAHDILRTFIDHYQEHPDSKSRLFIATKAGPKHLHYKHSGDSVLSLLSQLSDRTQYNGSIGIMPEYLHRVLQPNSATLEERLEAISLCNQNGIYARSVLVQPIIPCYLDEQTTEDFVKKVKSVNIENIKPEFLTVNFENLAIISQYVNHFDPELVEPLLKLYLDPKNLDHIKQRQRIAPSREWSKENLEMISQIAKQHGISTSLCNWVNRETSVSSDLFQLSKEKGFCCLGYQEGIFSW